MRNVFKKKLRNRHDFKILILSRFLNVNFTRLTNRGMQMLCREENGSPGCSLIESISIANTEVTHRGVRTILLSQTNLRIVQCDFYILFAALLLLSAEFISNGTPRTFPLTRIPAVRLRNNRDIGLFERAISICNQLVITRLEIECDRESSDLTDRDVVRILSLANFRLQELTFDGLTDSSITFANGIAPILELMGSTLQILQICGVENVDLSLIITRCPNLLKLGLDHNKSYVRNVLPRTSKVCLPQLKEFSFDANEESDNIQEFPCANQMSFILSSPMLKRLFINYCTTLSDDVLAFAFRQSNFENLTDIDISGCHSITNTGLDLFKRDENSISYLYLDNCNSVDMERFNAEWKLKEKERNWKVEVFST